MDKVSDRFVSELDVKQLLMKVRSSYAVIKHMLGR